MNAFRYFFFLIIAAFCLSSVCAQSADNENSVYGFDPLLYNGRIYYFFPKPGTKGSQYLDKDFDSKGAITLRGVPYLNQNISYDIYNQLLVFKYVNAAGSTNMISISEAWLEAFELGSRHFETFAGLDSTKRIYQVLGNNREKIVYRFSKELMLDSFKSSGSHYFSEVKKEMFLLLTDKTIPFKNNRGFIKAFPPEDQDLIKKFIRLNKINVKNASDGQMRELVDYYSIINR